MMPDQPAMRDILREQRSNSMEMLRLLGRFVRCESPSYEKPAVDRFARMVAGEWRKRGAQVRILRQRERGIHVRAEVWLGSHKPDGQIMVLGHTDTVYPMRTIEKMPFHIARGRAWGPGTFDMKGGHVIALAAVDALRALRARPKKRIVFFWNSDEEIGSESSRILIEREARRSDAVLVLEPSYGAEGKLKTRRKGVGTAEVIVKGRSAHAGIDPENGRNAVHELAMQIARLVQLNDPRRGIAVQATVVRGGTLTNVVPEEARAMIDIRFARTADANRIMRKLRGLRPVIEGTKIEVKMGGLRPPLERSLGVRRLFAQAQILMREAGLPLAESATGGGSDGCFTAALGIPTLDGLGAVGEGAHSSRENILVRALPERAALLAGLLISL